MDGRDPEGLHPLPETTRALTALSRYADEDLNERLGRLVQDVSAVAPGCGGLTISYLREGVAFTWLSSGVEVALLDGVQYLDGGPCVDSHHSGTPVETDADDPLSEQRWALFARIAAAGGVQSTLSLPFVRDGHVVGGVNFYGTTEDAFEGRHEVLADLVGAWPAGAVTNADLSLSGVEQARHAPQTIEANAVIDQAVGMLMAAQHVDSETAKQRLAGAAERAGIDTSLLAQVVVKGRLLG